MNRQRFGQTFAAFVVCATFVALAPIGATQEPTVRIEGKVAWIAGEKMLVALPGSLPVTVNLSEVDLDQYRALLSGDRVIVTGRPLPEGNRMMATSVQRL